MTITRGRAGLVTVLTLILTGSLLAACGTPPGPGPAPPIGPAPAPAGFAWFRPGPAPADWRSLEPADRRAALAYPPTAVPVHADPGAVAAATVTRGGEYVVYLNETPRQGGESLSNWARFRVAHLADDGTRDVTLDATAGHLSFHGQAGACVLDDYVSRVGSHRYREIACLVHGGRGDSVLVAATLAVDWPREHMVLERAVDSFVTR